MCIRDSGAHPCIISMEGLEKEGDTYVIPHVHELLTPLVSVVALQLISYYAALHLSLIHISEPTRH
ncbi:hypothetical protein JMUB7556_28210 [Staphylococcus aureus]